MSPFRFSLLSEDQKEKASRLLLEWEQSKASQKKQASERLFNYLQSTGIVVHSRLISCCSTWLEQATGWTQYAQINNWQVDE